MLLKLDAKLANHLVSVRKAYCSDYCSVFLPLNINCLSSHCIQTTVHGVMSDDVARFFNLLTTTQFWATMAYLSREY
ncbi:unnamed protein product [Brassica oleracea var. botrytis]